MHANCKKRRKQKNKMPPILHVCYINTTGSLVFAKFTMNEHRRIFTDATDFVTTVKDLVAMRIEDDELTEYNTSKLPVLTALISLFMNPQNQAQLSAQLTDTDAIIRLKNGLCLGDQEAYKKDVVQLLARLGFNANAAKITFEPKNQEREN